MRVLVTGGAGYVGSHAAKQLAKSGHDVLIVDNLAEGHRPPSANCRSSRPICSTASASSPR